MASGEGSPLNLLTPPIHQSSPINQPQEDENSTHDEVSMTSGSKSQYGRSAGRHRGHHWHPAPASQQLITFKTTSFWERKENEQNGHKAGGRPQRSLFTTNSSNQQRQVQNASPPPRSKFEGRRESDGWDYGVPSASNSVSQSSFVSGSPVRLSSPIASSSRQSIIPREIASCHKLKMVFNGRGEVVDKSVLGVLVSSQGFITVRLNQGIKVDVTLNMAFRMQSNPASIIVALNANGCTSAMIHPSGRVYQYGSRVEITAIDKSSNIKLAKMSHKGISFTGDGAGLVYLIDSGGTRSTSDVFSDMSADFSMPVFKTGAMIGPELMDQCMAALHDSKYWISEDGVEHWCVNGIRISQAQDGMVRVNRSAAKYQLRSSPLNGTVNFTTPYVHCTASVGDACHLFVKRGERRLHYDGVSFIVRNAGHSAGYDEKNNFRVY